MQANTRINVVPMVNFLFFYIKRCVITSLTLITNFFKFFNCCCRIIFNISLCAVIISKTFAKFIEICVVILIYVMNIFYPYKNHRQQYKSRQKKRYYYHNYNEIYYLTLPIALYACIINLFCFKKNYFFFLDFKLIE